MKSEISTTFTTRCSNTAPELTLDIIVLPDPRMLEIAHELLLEVWSHIVAYRRAMAPMKKGALYIAVGI